MEQKREHFGSRFTVIMAMAGAAIGLGNIWRFPYMVGEHGGAAFIIVYILATLIISLPVFISEVIIGRRSATSAYGAMSKLAPGKVWVAAGYLPVLIPMIITSYYSVVGGWSLDFLVKSFSGAFTSSTPDAVTGLFGDFVSSTWTPVLAHLIFLAACGIVIALGVTSGIEKFSKLTIPALFVLVVVIMVYSLNLPGAKPGVTYLIKPDLSQLTPQTFAYAMGQSFFSLSLGMGAIITYGSYVSKKENVLASSGFTAFFDVLFAILAGFAIMPAVFAADVEPGAGPGLIFQTIPFVFAKMGASMPLVSNIIAVIFFVTIIVAAMTSTMCMYEVGVAYLIEHSNIKRGRASVWVFLLCGITGVFCSLSLGPLQGLKIGSRSLFDFFDWFSSNILLTLAGFLSVFFVGWIMKKKDVEDEFTNGGTLRSSKPWFKVFYFLARYIAPAAVIIIFITNFIL